MSTKKKPITTGRAESFTIDRSKWLQGGYAKHVWKKYEKSIDSMLCNTQGMKCCLGFYAQACGVKRILNRSTLGDLDDDQKKKVDHRFFNGDGIFSDSDFASNLMSKNDFEGITPKKREEYIKNRFASIGVKVKFIGKYPYAK